MKIVALGAGALGSVYGGYLSKAGYDVTLVGRSAHIQAVNRQGLRISGRDEFVADVQATTDARALREADLLLICVRGPDTAQALADVAHLRPEIVVSFQNGIRKDEPLIACFGPGPVMGATSVVGARIMEPGHARCTSFGHTWFGELNNRPSPRLQAVVSVWERAGLLAAVSDDIRAAEWSKLAYLLPVSALSGLTRLPYHQILQSPDLAYLLVQMVREIGTIAKVYGVELYDLPGINVLTLTTGQFDQSIRILSARGKALEASGQTDISTNLLHDITIGRKTEIENLAGDLVRLAYDAAISTPALNFAHRAIRGIDGWVQK
ncbi:MAG: 2-dehydropantoate 2-reductase [Caldilineales bacterium]|nr:2-dehydropantoate 2-reductase [Caldilineales bacterium]